MECIVDLKPINVLNGRIYYYGDVPSIDYDHYVTLKKISITSNNFIDINKLLCCPLLNHSSIDNIFPYTPLFMYVFESLIKKHKCLITDTSINIHPHKKHFNADIVHDKVYHIEHISLRSDLELNIQIILKIKKLKIDSDSCVNIDRFEQLFSHAEKCKGLTVNNSHTNYSFDADYYYYNARFISFICLESDIVHIQKISYTLTLWVGDLRYRKEFETSDIITKKIGNHMLCFVPLQYINNKTLEYNSFSEMRKDVKSCYELPESTTDCNSKDNALLSEVEIVLSSGCSNNLCKTIYITHLW